MKNRKPFLIIQLFLFMPVVCIIMLSCSVPAGDEGTSVSFIVTAAEELHQDALDGRLLLFLADNNEREPRYQVSSGPNTQLVFGTNVESWETGNEVIIPDDVYGYPIENMVTIPEGDYYVQALLHKYETVTPVHEHTIKLPMERGEGQQWRIAPGNLYSTPFLIHYDPSKKEEIRITLDQVNPPIEEPEDTKYIKHIKIQSKLLSDFWGQPMYLGAHVLLPEGFDEHPEAHYPICIFHGHFPRDFGGFSETPPDPDLEADYSARFDVNGYNRIQQEAAYQFYKEWTGPDFPRMLIIEVQHANPFYDDSYAVNSANLGPYGDAITHELIPEVEKRFRGIGEGWARFLYGGSTGGWEALAVQVFYPDDYNGCFAACPDPIDFRAYTLVNIYKHKNAYFLDSKYKKTFRPGRRNYLGEVSNTLMDDNLLELVLGTNSRSGGQWDIWQAVYSPVGEDGYPEPIWNKLTGEIDSTVADYWKEHYDLRYILERDWETLGPKLEGKIHVYCGDMDTYYLNNAVYLMEEFLENTTDPYYAGEVDYGDRAEHCWNGDQTRPNHLSRLRYNQMYVPKILKRIKESAPAGADLTSWKY